MRTTLSLLAVTVAIVLPSTSHAATCTHELQAGGNVQAFIDSVPTGGVGCLHGGSYTAGNLRFNHGGMTLQSFPFERATVNVTTLYVPPASRDVTLNALDIVGGAASAVTVQLNGNRARLTNSDVTNLHRAESCIDVGYYTTTAAVVEGNRIHGCGKASNGNHDHGIYLEGAPSVTVRDNTIEDICCGWTVQAWPYTTGTIEGNTLRASAGASEGGVIIAGGSQTTGLTVRDNTIVGNGRASVFDAYQLKSGSATASGNCIVPNGSAVFESGWVDGGNKLVASEQDCAASPPPPPESGYSPACSPTCDEQIADLKADLGKALDQLARILSIAQE